MSDPDLRDHVEVSLQQCHKLFDCQLGSFKPPFHRFLDVGKRLLAGFSLRNAATERRYVSDDPAIRALLKKHFERHELIMAEAAQ